MWCMREASARPLEGVHEACVRGLAWQRLGKTGPPFMHPVCCGCDGRDDPGMAYGGVGHGRVWG